MDCPCGDYKLRDELTKHAPFDQYYETNESKYVDYAPIGLQERTITCSSCKYMVEGSMYKSLYKDAVINEPEQKQIHCHVLHRMVSEAGVCRFWGSDRQTLSQEGSMTNEEEVRLELEIVNSKISEEVSENK